MSENITNSIPQPKPNKLLGNLPDLNPDSPVMGMMELAKKYGPIFKLELPGREMLVISSQELVNELCDEQRFDKKVHTALRNIRDFAGDGLFTAETQEEDWGKAHRILMPVFGPAALRTMYDGMVDIAEQLLLKWERLGPEQNIDVVDNTTRLTLDTIALCAFDYRFNSFYQTDMHPFVGAMVRALSESGNRGRRLPIQNRLMLITKRQYDEDIRYMHQIADELINERKKHGDPEGKKDILNTMLNAKDPLTGEKLSDENIRYQMVTFLIAGHETTSGLLSFTIYEMLKHPEVMEKARAEIERVIGNRVPAFEDLPKLTYLDQILKETLRLWPTAPAFAVYSTAPETVVGDNYPVSHDQTLFILTPALHRDPKVWGEDAEKFNPDHFSFENAEKLPPNAWKPFGNGQRSCIGRPFALQEATLLLAMMLQRFDLSLADQNYQLKIKETLTMKPEGLFIRAKRRSNVIVQSSQPPIANTLSSQEPAAPNGPEVSNNIPLTVLYGSNAGSSEAFAQRIATDAKAQGYVPTIASLNEAVDNLPKQGAVVIVTASYEGQPTDNARKFVAWLDTLSADSLKGVKYTVFGCGNKDWARTYQAIPKRVDQKLAAAGAERIIERGEANARGDFFGDFDRWYANFWTHIGEVFGQEARKPAALPLLEVEFVAGTREPLVRQNNLQMGTVVENRELVNLDAPDAHSKRHIEIALPVGANYRAGDYLAVLPVNPANNVDRALRRFALPYDAQVVLHVEAGTQTFFPLNQPLMAGELLTSYVDLGQPATRSQIEQLIGSTPCPPEKHFLENLLASEESYEQEVLEKRVSLLDLLEQTASSSLSFASFLQLLQPMKPRQYSISSSPLWSEDHCTLTFAVVEGPAWSGRGTYQGAASTYLANARPGSKIAVMTRPSNTAFHLPESPETPIIMVAAGTGIAPFHGFLQERAIKLSQGEKLAPALLFFGCAGPNIDFLYKDELQEWEQQGVVSVRPAFSREPQGEVKYVQDCLWQDRHDVEALVRQGAILYLCGDGQRMAPAVYDTCIRIYQDATGSTREQAENWMNEMEREHGRYVADVFA